MSPVIKSAGRTIGGTCVSVSPYEKTLEDAIYEAKFHQKNARERGENSQFFIGSSDNAEINFLSPELCESCRKSLKKK